MNDKTVSMGHFDWKGVRLGQTTVEVTNNQFTMIFEMDLNSASPEMIEEYEEIIKQVEENPFQIIGQMDGRKVWKKYQSSFTETANEKSSDVGK